MDSVLYRRLITNLSKCSIIRVDLTVLNGKLGWKSQRNYVTQNIQHSTHSPPKIRADVEPSSLYVNPICMQLDQLMYNCTNHEELLNLLVTHRGAMYLHNLVTVMKILRSYVELEDRNRYIPDCDDLFLGYNKVFERKEELSEKSMDFSKFSKSEKEVIRKAERELTSHFQDPKNEEYLRVKNHSRDLRDAIIRDERYDLLLQDLYVNKNKLDVASICNVIMTLDVLDHRYYRLYNGLLKRLLSLDISFADKAPSFVNDVGILLLKTCECYARSGFNDVPLYNKVTRELISNNLAGMMSEESERQLLSQIISLYSQVRSYDHAVFSKISESVESLKLSPRELSCLAVMYSNHENMNKMHDRVMYHIAERIGSASEEFTLSELCTSVSAFTKMKLYFGEVWRTCTRRLMDSIEVSMNGYEDIEIDVKTLCKAVSDLATMDNSSSGIHSLVDGVSLYMEDKIDELDEESAINLAMSVVIAHSSLSDKSMAHEGDDSCCGSLVAKQVDEDRDGSYVDLIPNKVDNMSRLNNYVISFVWRRIGSDVVWEREPLKVFAIWLYHMLVFPHFNYNISRRCIMPCYRQWLLVYNTRHEMRDELLKIVNKMSSKFKMYTKYDEVESYKRLLESPVPVDILVVDENYGNKAINIVDSSVRNDHNRATGVDLVIKGILEQYGLEVHFIDTHHWMRMNANERESIIESIIVNGS